MGFCPGEGPVETSEVRRRLAEAQFLNPELKPIREQLLLSPHSRKDKRVLKPVRIADKRLAEDGVLEPRVMLHQGIVWFPDMPNVPISSGSPTVTWRRWLLDQLHGSFAQNHRTTSETFNLVLASAYWPKMMKDCAEWSRQCEVCA